jgi:hypothetical protein
MLRFAFAGTLAVFLVAGARPARAAEDEGVKAIVAKAVEARGGAAAIAKYKASTVKIKGKVFTEVGDGEMTATLQTQPPDKFRLEMQLKFGGADISYGQVVDGKKGWMVVNNEKQDLPQDVFDETREQIHAGQVAELQALHDKGVELSPLGASKEGEVPVVGVRVATKGYRDVSLYFDKDKGLLLRSEMRVKDTMSGEEFTEVKHYGDYKKVNGLMVAHKVTATRDGKPRSEAVVTEVTPAESLPDATFAKP